MESNDFCRFANQISKSAIDRDGNVYVSVPELDAAVLSENSVACDENGELLCFSVFDARRMKVITMESAMEQLEMGIG